MRTIRIEAGRSVWLIVIDGREVATNVPISRPLTQAARAAVKMFPDAAIDAPTHKRPLFRNNRAFQSQEQHIFGERP